jgi:hypothetical protein
MPVATELFFHASQFWIIAERNMPYNAAKFYVGTVMGFKTELFAGMCLSLCGTASEAGGTGRATGDQINIPNVNPIVERRFEQLRQKEANERMQRENSQDAAEMISLAAQLRRYSEAAESSGLPPDAVKKANELEKLARRVRHRVKEQMLRVRAR